MAEIDIEYALWTKIHTHHSNNITFLKIIQFKNDQNI